MLDSLPSEKTLYYRDLSSHIIGEKIGKIKQLMDVGEI
jgi:hypothetical protein